MRNKSGRSILEAYFSGDTAEVERLLDQGVDVNNADNEVMIIDLGDSLSNIILSSDVQFD